MKRLAEVRLVAGLTLASGSRPVRCELVGSSLDRVVRGLTVVVR